MNILATQYTLKTKSLEIYVAGCKGDSHGKHCEGCHNPEGWDFNLGEKYDNKYEEKLKQKIKSFDDMIDNIMVFGGEPLDQPYVDLKQLIDFLKTTNKTLWLFTKYNIDEVLSNNIFGEFDYIKCGCYDKNLITDDNIQYGIKLATSNQKIYKRGVDY